MNDTDTYSRLHGSIRLTYERHEYIRRPDLSSKLANLHSHWFGADDPDNDNVDATIVILHQLNDLIITA